MTVMYNIFIYSEKLTFKVILHLIYVVNINKTMKSISAMHIWIGQFFLKSLTFES